MGDDDLGVDLWLSGLACPTTVKGKGKGLGWNGLEWVG